MVDLSSREKDILHKLFSPGSIQNLLKWFPETTSAEWEVLYSKLLDRRSGTNKMVLYVDGAFNPRKNIAGIGGVFYLTDERGKEGEELFTFSENIGKATNNIAEYSALIRGLEYAQQLGGSSIRIYSDSELMVRQINLDYKVKSENLLKLYHNAKMLLNEFQSWSLEHIPRNKNRKADILSANGLRLKEENRQ